MPKTETFGTRFTVKEDGNGDSFLAIELDAGPPNSMALENTKLYLLFRKKLSYDEAQAACREMNDRFRAVRADVPVTAPRQETAFSSLL